ncbi:hypothetical protein NDU88_004134 [Pleurodeles waltl]|uniref:Uncharacterized protein n=1 Tax=Pleurodeles waltl TaxID=8319 RepID=A0AAV7PE92_PLEWA|nr:hypothetical protein NDU88_004134 [Pleurodeles waltl]
MLRRRQSARRPILGSGKNRDPEEIGGSDQAAEVRSQGRGRHEGVGSVWRGPAPWGSDAPERANWCRGRGSDRGLEPLWPPRSW